jgi:hypothetical protein
MNEQERARSCGLHETRKVWLRVAARPDEIDEARFALDQIEAEIADLERVRTVARRDRC